MIPELLCRTAGLQEIVKSHRHNLYSLDPDGVNFPPSHFKLGRAISFQPQINATNL